MELLIPFIAVIIGYGIAMLFNPKNKALIKLLLAFSGAFLLTATVSHLLPSIYEQAIEASHSAANTHDHSSFKWLGLWIMIGIIFQIILEYFSKGAEHGHTHAHLTHQEIPWLLFISLCLHALFEGMPIDHHHHLAWAIAVHHLPIAIILTLFFKQTPLSNRAVFIFMFLFALMTPLGTYLSSVSPTLTQFYPEVTAFVVGILFHISSTIIFESSEGHRFNARKLAAILFGICLAMFV